jgi:SAM-dependent methyltransferase
MTKIDRLLQRWRFAKAARFIPKGARVLDVGSDDGAMFDYLGDRIEKGLGIDHAVPSVASNGRWRVIAGTFPDDVPDERFDVITALAVLEHIPDDRLAPFRDACIERLVPGGRFIATVPSPAVDRILHVLERLKLIHGMALHEHHGFEATSTPAVFSAPQLRLKRARRFQLGLNHLFVFERPVDATLTSPSAGTS